VSALEVLEREFIAHGQASAEARIDVEDLLAVLTLAQPAAQRATDDEVLMLLGRFAQRADVDVRGGADAALAKIAGYLRERPLRMDLLQRCAAFVREHLAAGSSVALDLNAARFLGVTPGKSAMASVNSERPSGTIPAGPLARFLVEKD
jgi:hypothetical protein